MRGEHKYGSISTITVLGSSPHARGAPDARKIILVVTGIIPACAGSTVND